MKKLGPEYRDVSLSHATMIADDVFDALRPFLPDELVAEYDATADEEEREMILNEEAFDHMNRIAPEGTYFGAHPGDGTDFGFWESEDQVESS